MGCLKLNPAMKQCLVKEVDAEGNHPGECVFTLLRPEVAAAQDLRKARDNDLVRRNLASSYIPTLLKGDVPVDAPNLVGSVVACALDIADELIKKTGGFGP